jgi:polyisoprenoid-binding protein YceI
MLRRILIGLAVTAVVTALVAVIVVRQLVFGGTPTINRTGSLTAPTPCATIGTPAGQFAFAVDTQQSSASYTAHFQAAGQDLPGTVTGVTGNITGQFLLVALPQPAIQSLTITIDLRSLDSGAAERDQHVRDDTLETAKYPFATFSATDTPILTGAYTQGQPVSFTLTGNLTLHGVTRPATFAMRGKLAADTVTGTGTTLIHLQDFHMKPPMTTSVVPIVVSPDVTLTISVTAQRTACASSS